MASFDRVVAPDNYRRSMNAELAEGATDGKYKKLVIDRGGLVEQATAQTRASLCEYYHVQQAPKSMEVDPAPLEYGGR